MLRERGIGRRIRRSRAAAPAAARSVRRASRIFSAGRRRAADGARQSVRLESRRRSNWCARARWLRARQSRERVAAHLGRGRAARRVVPMRSMRDALAAASIYEDRQRDRRRAGARRRAAPPVAYLAYHDTIDPDPALRPLDNVWFEWAPRERCYSHAIDDPACAINPRYLESLKRYIDIFDGRGHVFEYYADAILFGGDGLRDARDHRARSARVPVGSASTSISCLTFGALQRAGLSGEPGGIRAWTRAISISIPMQTLDETAREPASAMRARRWPGVSRGRASVGAGARLMAT